MITLRKFRVLKVAEDEYKCQFVFASHGDFWTIFLAQAFGGWITERTVDTLEEAKLWYLRWEQSRIEEYDALRLKRRKKIRSRQLEHRELTGYDPN